MPTPNSTDSEDQKAEDAITQANQDLNDQGDIAADDAGGTAAAHRVQDALDKTPRAPD